MVEFSRKLVVSVKSLFLVLIVVTVTPLQAAVILQYHHVDVDTPTSTSTTPQQFLQHLKIIESEGFTVVPLMQLFTENTTKNLVDKKSKNMLDKRVAITFDDGYRSVFTEAYPLLKSRQWPFTVFVNTAPIDKQSTIHVSWDQLREMAAHGATIGNHTRNHNHLLQRLDGETLERWQDRVSADILTAQTRIENELGQNERLLAYPYGEFDHELEELTKALDFMAFGQHSGAVSIGHSRQAIPRFPFGGQYGEQNDFRMKISTLAFPMERVVLMGAQGVVEDGHLIAGDEVSVFDLILSDEVGTANCFGPAPLSMEQTHQRIRVTIKGVIPVGRSRINCTARHFSGRYHWFSQPFFRPSESGLWLD